MRFYQRCVKYKSIVHGLKKKKKDKRLTDKVTTYIDMFQVYTAFRGSRMSRNTSQLNLHEMTL